MSKRSSGVEHCLAGADGHAVRHGKESGKIQVRIHHPLHLAVSVAHGVALNVLVAVKDPPGVRGDVVV